MKAEGWSNRAIGRELGIPESSIRYMLKQDKDELQYDPEDVAFSVTNRPPKTQTPKILVIDIETAPVLGSVWSLWNNNLSLNQINNDWYILSYCAKWYDEDEIFYKDKRNSWDTDDDTEILEEVWELMNQADFVLTQNGKRFDEKKLNARFIINGMKPPSSYRSIDTLEIAKRHFGFTSNKLAYMTDKLCKLYKKLDHGKFAGFELWKECLKGNPEAWDEMEEYNKYDVLSLQELYDVLRPWYKAHPNLSVYRDDYRVVCNCGNTEFNHVGYHYTNLGKYDKFSCTECGSERRGSVNLIPKEFRVKLQRNII